MVASNARKIFGFLHISFYKVVQIVLPIIKRTQFSCGYNKKRPLHHNFLRHKKKVNARFVALQRDAVPLQLS